MVEVIRMVGMVRVVEVAVRTDQVVGMVKKLNVPRTTRTTTRV